jgi:hypothetical protein
MYEAKMAAAAQVSPRSTMAYHGDDCCVERTSEVSRALDELNSVIQRYDHLVGRLSSRLHCVVIPAPPICSGNDKPIQGYQTELANHINGIRCTARDITDSLESLLERIEV